MSPVRCCFDISPWRLMHLSRSVVRLSIFWRVGVCLLRHARDGIESDVIIAVRRCLDKCSLKARNCWRLPDAKSGQWKVVRRFSTNIFAASSNSDGPCAVEHRRAGDPPQREEKREVYNAPKTGVRPWNCKRDQFFNCCPTSNCRSYTPSALMPAITWPWKLEPCIVYIDSIWNVNGFGVRIIGF